MQKSSASKPISSPGRTDKYPPPLMRFLRGNMGSKSRGRSRAVPLFTRRKRASGIDAQQQEPSSPKVTCIGQVRVRRSSSKSKSGLKNRDPPPAPPLRRRPSSSSASNSAAGNWFCFWTGKPPARCCSFRFRRRRHPRWVRKWVSFFRCRSVRVRTDSSKKGSNSNSHSNPTGSGQIFYSDSTDSDSFEVEEEEDEESIDHSGRVNGSDPPITPPKNALLLTRCRSAPQRSSYLVSRFWGSPLKTGEQENRVTTTADKSAQGIGSSSEIGQIQRNTAVKSRTDQQKEGNLEIREEQATESEAVGSSKKTETENEGEEEGEEKQSKTGDEENEKEKVVVLTRCKSEPARRSGGDPLTVSFWKERRLESTVSCRNSIESK